MVNAVRFTVLFACLALASACGSSTTPDQPKDCSAVALNHVAGGATTHVASCDDPSACGNGQNPPTGGPHCSTPLNCRSFSSEQKVCSWVHNLEHGHAVLLYNCPDGCPDIVDGLNQLRLDRTRVLITPDSSLPTKVGAVVWGYSWTGDAFDANAINCLLTHQDEEAPEAGLSCSP